MKFKSLCQAVVLFNATQGFAQDVLDTTEVGRVKGADELLALTNKEDSDDILGSEIELKRTGMMGGMG